MTPDHAARLIAEAAAAIDAERLRLLQGDIDRLDEAAAARAEALEVLAGLGDDAAAAVAPQLAALRRAAARHAETLGAALSGARSARRRLQQMIDARTRLPGYDAAGAPRATPPPGLSSRRV